MFVLNKLYVVGIGPGAADQMTVKALRALESCNVIAGYGVYVDLVKPLLPDKEYLVTPMRKEVDRCRMAIDCALSGKTTAMISSGDAGVYGMAGLIHELAEGKDVEIEVIPGVTAALSGGAVLGAPLTHDFAVISLSDALTPWEKIEKRLDCAAQSDMGIVLYNPMSMGRPDNLRMACDILLKTLPADRPCGVAHYIGREGEERNFMTLGELRDTKVDMFSTVFIGNAATKMIGGNMVTPRGYRDV